VLDLENTKTSQAAKIAKLKERVKKLEKKGGSKTHKIKRLYKIGRSARVVSSKDEHLGDQEDASKQERKITDIDQDASVTLVNKTQGRHDADTDMFGVNDLVVMSTVDPVTTAGEVVTTVCVEISNELTLAQTLIEIKSAKPKAVTTAATTVTRVSIRPRAKGIVFHDQEEQASTSTPIVSSQQPSQATVKDKGKAKMIEPKKPLKKKDQIMLD
nr:hypothetical protein [Tanacetum cinerariifolium]